MTPPVLLLLLLLASPAAADEFVFPGFSGGNGVVTSGAAMITSSGLMQLTNETKEVFGHGFHSSPVNLRNSSTGKAVSFSTTFVFAIVPKYPDAHGHGLAFALSPSASVPGAVAGKYLGIFSNGERQPRIVAVEFDTAMDEELGDIDDNHVGVDVGGVRSVASRTAGISLIGGEPLQAWIDYDGESGRLDVTLSPAGVPRPATPLVTSVVNLSSAVAAAGDGTFVGFSAANGAAASSHYVLAWTFLSGAGGGAPEIDLAKIPHLPSPTKSKSKNTPPAKLLLILLLILAVTILLASSATIATIISRRRRRRFAEEEEEDWEIEYGPHRISYKDLHGATRGFRDVIGAGGFGRVYHGVLAGGVEVAVKKVSHGSRQGIREFVAEIASMSRLRHRNLVQLLGYCRRRGELVLVYDYMCNGSLDNHLFGAGDRPPLTWQRRGKIVRDVVVHRDIKASNVLLDADMNGKLSDFGLARLYDHGTNPQTTRVVGTLGYLAPELSKTGKATTATDVFAFGAFLLEVACGRRPMEFAAGADGDDSPGLVELVLEHWKSGEITAARDPKLIGAGDCDEDDLEVVLKLGLLCSHPDPRRRPSMRQVVQILEGAAPAPETMPEDLACSGRLFYSESFDEFVTGFGLPSTTSEITTATTRPTSSSNSTDEQQRLKNAHLQYGKRVMALFLGVIHHLPESPEKHLGSFHHQHLQINLKRVWLLCLARNQCRSIHNPVINYVNAVD
uniref:non-specific serine/threonine protein kinase n=1 Tax=Leersia perrieri TaxID=77586 RepID=A0A0D9W0U6_9ORYZ